MGFPFRGAMSTQPESETREEQAEAQRLTQLHKKLGLTPVIKDRIQMHDRASGFYLFQGLEKVAVTPSRLNNPAGREEHRGLST